MKHIFALTLAASVFAFITIASAEWVNGYTRSNGTYVKAATVPTGTALC